MIFFILISLHNSASKTSKYTSDLSINEEVSMHICEKAHTLSVKDESDFLSPLQSDSLRCPFQLVCESLCWKISTDALGQIWSDAVLKKNWKEGRIASATLYVPGGVWLKSPLRSSHFLSDLWKGGHKQGEREGVRLCHGLSLLISQVYLGSKHSVMHLMRGYECHTAIQRLEAPRQSSSGFMSSLAAIQPYHILSNARAKSNTSAQEGSQSIGKEMKFIIPADLEWR